MRVGALAFALALAVLVTSSVAGTTPTTPPTRNAISTPTPLSTATPASTPTPTPTPTASSTETPSPAAALLPSVEMGHWVGTSFGAYLPPARDFIDADGGVDVVFHFNAAMLAEKSWRRSNLNAVLVSQAFSSFGTGAYADAFADRGRFQRMLDEVLRTIARAEHRSEPLHARRITLVGWSAGFAAVGAILSVPPYFAMVDSVVLLDGLHAQYNVSDPSEKHAQMGAEKVNVRQLASFIAFAREAAAGSKAMVVTHTSIVPPDYASSTESSRAMLRELGVATHETDDAAFGMKLRYRADAKNLHVLGFHGGGPQDHMQHLHAVGDVVRTFIAPRMDALFATDERARALRAEATTQPFAR